MKGDVLFFVTILNRSQMIKLHCQDLLVPLKDSENGSHPYVDALFFINDTIFFHSGNLIVPMNWEAMGNY